VQVSSQSGWPSDMGMSKADWVRLALDTSQPSSHGNRATRSKSVSHPARNRSSRATWVPGWCVEGQDVVDRI